MPALPRQPSPGAPCVLILDFGGQYTHLIARRVREKHVFSRVMPYTASVAEMRAANPVGVILSGGPASVLADDAPRVDPAAFALGVPTLGICYGMQLMAHTLGGAVERGEQREYGRVPLRASPAESALVRGVREESVCWMSHTYQVSRAPDGFHAAARTANCPIAAMADELRRLYAVQFHPEVTHTEEGATILDNFLFGICGCKPDFTMASYAASAIAAIREEVKPGERVLLGLSGGVDSSVAAALLQRAIGDRLVCVLVDHGLMRKGECGQVIDVFTRVFPVKLVYADASERFFRDLAGVVEPEAKRRVVGRDFVDVFREESAKLGRIEHFAQGTIYPDVIESGAAKGAAVIKSHHNVGGLPAELGFQSLIEPLRLLFKDEVRALGLSLGLPESLVKRQPFPGPGLAIRVVGEVTREKVRIVRESDAILREEMAREGLDRVASQFFTVLTGARSVGVMGDERTYAYAVAIRAVTTDDFMTADFARIPYEALGRIAARIVGEVPGVNRVLYDVTTKPPASIEWE